MTTVSLQNITKYYTPNAPAAVHSLNLELSPGSILALLGPSGCGKTTTLKLIAGLLQPEEGRIWFDGQDVTGLAAEQRNAVMVFQHHALFPFMSVGANIGFGLKIRKMEKKLIAQRVREMLELVQLPGMQNRMPAELSGGQQQRVALARALVTRPRLLLLDEPLANLDAHLRDEMRGLILDIQKKTAVSTIIVTHDQEEAMMLADRVALMFNGRLVQYDDPETMFRKPVSAQAARFLGVKNIFPAVRDKNQVATAFGQLQLDAEDAYTVVDGPCMLAFRSEHIRIAGVHDVNIFSALIKSRTYLGLRVSYLALLDGTEVQFLCEAQEAKFSAGEIVTLCLPSEHITLLPLQDPQLH